MGKTEKAVTSATKTVYLQKKPSLKRASQRDRFKALAKAAALLSDDGWRKLVCDLKLEAGFSRSDALHKPSVLGSRLSQTSMVSRLIEDHRGGLSMLRFVVSFLSNQGVSARTTNVLQILPGLQPFFGPQSSDVTALWTEDGLRRLKQLGDLEDLWENALESLIGLHQEAVRSERSYKPFVTGVFMPQDVSILDFEKIDKLKAEVALISQSFPPRSFISEDLVISGIHESFQELEAEWDLSQWEGPIAHDEAVADLEAVRLLCEALRASADIDPAIESLSDLFSLDIFRDLPQLFEVWLLCFTLSQFEASGHKITLSQTTATEGTRQTWELKYARGHACVARIDSDLYVWFQRKGTRGSTMPDIAIFDNADAAESALAVIDAKFSELGGYVKQHYSNTAEKYASLGGVVLIVEHFNRDFNLGPDVIFDVNAAGAGISAYIEALFSVVARRRRAHAMIDKSDSYKEILPKALKLVGQLLDKDLFHEQYLAFGETAVVKECLSRDLQEEILLNEGPSNATSLLPLKEAIGELPRGGEPLLLALFSDGDFNDGCVADLRTVGDIIWELRIDK